MAEWDSAYINELPDSAFAYIESGGEKDGDGKTVPRSLRHYPHHDSTGSVDLPHLRNALSRVAQEATTSEGRGHLEAHAKNEGVGTTRSVDVDAVVTVRSASARELDMRIMPWGRTIETTTGQETFDRGAFEGTDPTAVRHWGLEHEVHLGIGQQGEPVVTRHPVGRGVALDERDDAAYMTTRLARTARADEVLALAEDGIASGVSIEFREVPGGSVTETRGGRRVRVHKKVMLTGVSTTYQPAYGQEAAVLAVRSEGGDHVTTETTAPVEPTFTPALDAVQIGSTIATEVGRQLEAAITAAQARSAITDETAAKFLERLEALEERTRMSISIPSKVEGAGHPDDFHRGDWLKMVLRTLTGETVSQAELQARVAADLITADNLGVIPTAYLNEIIGIIDPARPFLETTTKIQTPRAGMTLSVPKIVTRPTTGVQDPEKEELTSTPTSIVPATFDPVTVGGYGDISIQLLKRSDPSYLSMYLDLLAEAYAIDADDLAVDALLAAAGVHSGGTVDPDDGPLFGDAWANAAAVSRRITPDTIWLATAAVAAFINAKSTTTNAPLYGNLAAAFSANRGVGGTISGLRPVHVPALDDENVDAIVGPSRGFVWAEDGTYTLQVDVPAKAGRDVGIVGMLWFAPLYPAAFTKYVVTS